MTRCAATRALRGRQHRKAQHRARPQGERRARTGAGPGRAGGRAGGGVPSRRHGTARAGRRGGPGPQPRHRLLLHLRLRAAGRARRPPRPRRELPGVGGGADPRGRLGHRPAPADGRPGVRADRRLRDLCRRRRPGRQRRGDLPRRRHDRRDGDVDGSVRRRCARRGPAPVRTGARATASSPPPTAGRCRSGSSTNSTSGPPSAANSDWKRCRISASTNGCGRGDELQRAIGDAVAVRDRDELVAALTGAGVPVAPVLDRVEMLASAPFPPFPVRLPLPDTTREVPALDQHRGEGFCDRP